MAVECILADITTCFLHPRSQGRNESNLKAFAHSVYPCLAISAEIVVIVRIEVAEFFSIFNCIIMTCPFTWVAHF
jgi:hypothetical protein